MKKGMNRIRDKNRKEKDKNRKEKGHVPILIVFAILSILIWSSVATAEQLRVSSSRYSLFSPWINKASDASLSANFTAYALLLDNNGRPVSGQSITFNITSPAGIVKASRSNITQSNGLASISYDTISDFTTATDTDYGTWRISAYQTSNNNVNGSTNMIIQAGGIAINSGCNDYCHSTNVAPGGKPQSPYTDSYGSTSSRAVAAHKKSQHQTFGCYLCHPGYATVKTGPYGNTNDVHKNRTCDFCHDTWTSFGGKSGTGIPKMPSCFQCHPIFNSNVKNISTIANLLGGNGISVYSYNFDRKAPLVAHDGVDYSLVTSVPCIACHGPAHNNTKPDPITANTNAVTENSQCWKCHTDRATTHKSNTNCVGCHTQDAHNVSISATTGGPDCISCHNVVGGSTVHRVDATAINSSEHANLNSGAAATVDPANKKCWGCHQTGGTQPTDMGDRYLNPYKCYDCHNATKPYANVGSALTVGEHFKSGTDIQAAISATDNSTSCLTCHILAEMKVSYTDNEFTNYSLASHYGKNRSDLRVSGSTRCAYCHQNTSTAFLGAMININNDNMSNHSTSLGTPGCTNSTCHNSGKLHDATLAKPVSSNDNYCKTCHIDKIEHNNTLYCTECHANNTDRTNAGRDIHGIQFLQKDNTFLQSRTNKADCTTCHQFSVVDSSLAGFSPPKISNPLHHSDDITNGSKWGNYWTISQGACIYCHNDTTHSTTPLGRPLIWNSSYKINTTIGSGDNCADCHYKGDSDYNAMNLAFTAKGLPIPPEITNGSWNGKPGYYNHTLSDYTDSQCKSCHDKAGSTTVGQMTHNAAVGSSGGPDCKLCHDVGGSAPALVNFSVMNDNRDGHKNLNSAASATVNAEDKKCWACHGDGIQPSGHPTRYKTPFGCTDCHISGNYSAPIVAQHSQVGQQVITAVNCTQCHSNVGMYLDSGGIGTIIHYYKEVTNMATQPYGHLGPIDTSNCIDCHNGPNTGNPNWGSPVNISTSTKRIHTETLTSQCDLCHKDASVSTLANVDFHNAAVRLGTGQGPNCLDCHASAR